VKAHRGFESLPLRQLWPGAGPAWQKDKFVNNWIHFAIWAAIIVALFGYLWWQGQIKALATYVQETREELKKCSWPSWVELRGSTVLIIVTVAMLGVFVVVVDRILFTVFIH
jgi:preprotein translocase subunit SecE